jgi:ABC-type lipoprotein export system ATPase subunit
MILLQKISKQDKPTFALATHDSQIEKGCDRQINVADGQIATAGSA